MFTLRLFHQGEPFTQIEARQLADGALTFGRDGAADWRVADESRTLSRLHCTFRADGDRLTLRDTSANGVFVGRDRRRVSSDADTFIAPGETVRFGDYMVLVEGPEPEAPKLQSTPPPSRTVSADTSLMEAFCAGAGLDASAFSAEEAAFVMHRVGEVYRQMVVGLTGLMRERIDAKAQYQLEQTTVRAGGNNPVRWAAADRVAVDLLRPLGDGFLGGAAAVESTFRDIHHHLICTVAGSEGAVAATLQALDPAAIEESLKGRGFALRGRAGEAWSRYVELHTELCGAAGDDPLPQNAFRDAYEERDALLQAEGDR